MARVRPDGTLDPTFAPNVARPALAAVRQSDGKVVCLDPTGLPPVYRLSADGAVDPSFIGPAGRANGRKPILAFAADDRLLVVRATTTSQEAVVRLLPDGREDSSFATGQGAVGLILGVRSMPDGSTWVWGYFSSYNGVPAAGIARLRPDGTADSNFSAELPAARYVDRVEASGDGGLLVVLTEVAESPAAATLARLGSTGRLLSRRESPRDPTFFTVVAWLARPGGTRLVTVPRDLTFAPPGTLATVEVTDLRSDDTEDAKASHLVPADMAVTALGVSPEGAIAFAERTTPYFGMTLPLLRERILLLRPGAADASLLADQPGETARAGVAGLVSASNDRVFTWGNFHAVDGITVPNGAAVLRPDNTWDADAAAGLGGWRGTIHAAVALPAGGWVIAGDFRDRVTSVVVPLLRLDVGGQVDPGWIAPARDSGIQDVRSLAIDAQGRTLAFGRRLLTGAGPGSAPALLRFRPDGGIDPDFHAELPSEGAPGTIAVLPDGRIYVSASSFTGSPLSTRRLLPDGRIDPTFDRANADFTAFSTRPDGALVAITSTDAVIPVSAEAAPDRRFRLRRILPDGSVDGSFVASGRYSGALDGVRFLRDGRLLVAGDFLTLAERSRFGLARLTTSGALDASFRPELPLLPNASLGAYSTVRQTGVMALAERSSGELLVAPAAGSDPLLKLLVDPLPAVPGRGRGQLVNVASRGRVEGGDRAMIAGFVVNGGSRRVVVRALGPSLAAAGVAGTLANPLLEIFSGGASLATNDDWSTGTSAAEITAAGLAPSDAREAAVALTLPPGAFTAVVRGSGGATGVGIIEVYVLDAPDLASPPPAVGAPRVVNLSTRAYVGEADNVLIGGFIIRGGSARVALRGLGPTLAGAGVTGTLADPYLQVVRSVDGKQILASDSWERQTYGVGNIQPLALPMPAPSEIGTALDLPEGEYTVIISGVNSGTGIGMFEVYELPDNGTP